MAVKKKKTGAPEEVSTICRLLDSFKAEEITVLNLETMHSYLDYFVIATANSKVHLKKLASECLKTGKDLVKVPVVRPSDEDYESGWVIIDFRDFVVHIFTAEKRGFYQLEKLWEKAEVLTWE